jgi:hypothetical protein
MSTVGLSPVACAAAGCRFVIWVREGRMNLIYLDYNANVFLTCDDNLIRQVKQLNLDMAVMNPVDYVRQEVI